MRAPAIVPTITQRVRHFLADHGAALRPWAGLSETYDELYTLLHRRRNDPEFWQPLKALLKEVVDSAAHAQRRGPRTNGEAELLASFQIDDLVDELRKALPIEASEARPSLSDFTRPLPSAVLGGFLLLGLAAAGCGANSNAPLAAGSAGSGTGGDALHIVGGVGAGVGGAGGDILRLDGSSGSDADRSSTGGTGSLPEGSACSESVATALYHAIDDSTLSVTEKARLCQCFATLSTQWTTSLTDLFLTHTPEEISAILKGLLPCCTESGLLTKDSSSSTTPSAEDMSQIGTGNGYKICWVPIYKGVSFPV